MEDIVFLFSPHSISISFCCRFFSFKSLLIRSATLAGSYMGYSFNSFIYPTNVIPNIYNPPIVGYTIIMVIYKHITTVINWKEGKIMSVGENIKKRREAKGLSQAELAGAIGVGQSYLSQIERGTKAASIQLGKQIAEILECTLDELA
ncbi:XRE family transcriptional regulator [Eisenbergiella massiliensis]|uniref:XRE family transcriptional regulator n=2 Tax=Lachnospiraceae TaxID=186803 RepID=A0A3E3HXB3_9FIRM|nr:XRE family transcriptional regulator [Eisenbergiella massiliensis]RGE70661.1 XRE family transcriptional regulator [Eisenbergiella massiliensis]